MITTTDYIGSYIYENGSLKFINHPEGYIEPNGAGGYAYVYQYKDHLGNVRLSYADANGDGLVESSEIKSERNYYPFGLQHKGYNSVVNGTHYPYGFNGKEEQAELDLNWLDFEARNYDPALGRWMSPDPLAEKFSSWSPYNSMMNNPINFIDPTGMAAEWVPEVKEDGSVAYVAEEGDSAETLSSQYGISQEQAEQITGTTGDTEINEGTEVSGETVEEVTGSEVLKLDLTF